MTPPATVSVAALTAADLAGAAAVDAAASADPWSQRQLADELARGDRRYLAAVERDPAGRRAVVGFAGLALLPDAAHVMTLAVRPDRRRQGIGERLLRGLLDVAAGVGLPVTLEVRVANATARRLYRRAGFAEAGRRPGYYPDGEDAVILSRR